ncbi:MAG: hypothetical protein K1Y36_23740 [Blastocatellia bacterium]|nr:hypothetical protein [Blastocatellia bacterium]
MNRQIESRPFRLSLSSAGPENLDWAFHIATAAFVVPPIGILAGREACRVLLKPLDSQQNGLPEIYSGRPF